MKKVLRMLFFLVSAGYVFSQVVLADDKKIESYADFPQSGVLAASGNLPAGDLALPQLPMGMLGQPIPLLGSISLSKDRHWVYGVSNNTEKPIKVAIELIQYDANRNKLSTSNYQYKLKPKAKAEGSAPAPANSAACVVFLKHWSFEK